MHVTVARCFIFSWKSNCFHASLISRYKKRLEEITTSLPMFFFILVLRMLWIMGPKIGVWGFSYRAKGCSCSKDCLCLLSLAQMLNILAQLRQGLKREDSWLPFPERQHTTVLQTSQFYLSLTRLLSLLLFLFWAPERLLKFLLSCWQEGITNFINLLRKTSQTRKTFCVQCYESTTASPYVRVSPLEFWPLAQEVDLLAREWNGL